MELTHDEIQLIKLAVNERAKSNEKMLKQLTDAGIPIGDAVVNNYLIEVWELDALYRKLCGEV